MAETPDSGSTPWGYRTVLSADSCLFHKGAVAHPGLLELGEDVLTFTPTRMLDRLAGAQDLEIPVSAITELAAGGIHHNMDVTVGKQTLRFSGKGALRVHARLVALLAEGEELPEGEEPLFEPGERVILQGPADLYVNDLVAVRGEITLSDVRFRFMPGVGLERLLWRSAQIDVPIGDVDDWSISGLRRLFECQINDRRVRVGGALAPTLFRHFSSMHQDTESPDGVGGSAIIEQWKVQLRRGPLAHPGEMDVTPDRLRFRPTGLLDAVVGVSAFDLELDQVTTLTRRGWAETKIEIRSGHKVHTFSIPEHEARFEGLMELIRDRHYRRISVLSPGDPSAYRGCLDAWSERIRYDDSEQVVVSTVGVLNKGPNEYRFGWLILTRSRLLFLPLGGPASKQTHLDLPLGQIVRLDGGPRTPDDQIYLSADEVAYRFHLAHREGLVEEFWAQCRSPTRVLDWSTIGPRSLSRVTGEARFIRILSHGELVVDLSPALTVPHKDGVAMLLPGEPGSSLPLEQWVTVEIGQSEGIYQFDSRVVRSAPIPLDLPVPDPDQMHLLITEFPTELRVYNQRDSYRVPTHMHLRAHVLAQVSDGGSWMSTGEAFECDMLDLSIGGALVRSMQPMEENQRVSLNLPLMDQWVEIRATCVRSDIQDPDHPGIMYGMEFRELSTTQEDMLHKAIMQLQREALVEEEEGEGVEDD
jgi:c-di-GMP-binding flagellar brake protein YcgR